MAKMKRWLKKVVAISGYEIINRSLAEQRRALAEEQARDLSPAMKLYNSLPLEKQKIIAQWLPYSRSQLAQDLFVLSELNSFNHEKYFVEFGATDGLSLSNTYLLEAELGWKGLLSEPAKIWHEKIKNNRSCDIDTRCVYSQSGNKVDFIEVGYEVEGGSPELSGMFEYADNGDWASRAREKSRNIYKVETVSLNDLLAEYQSPPIISYLSIDTEGSELSILRALDFSKYKFRVITVEHNFTSNRDDIKNLLVSNGYVRKYEHLSLFDDWYVLNS